MAMKKIKTIDVSFEQDNIIINESNHSLIKVFDNEKRISAKFIGFLARNIDINVNNGICTNMQEFSTRLAIDSRSLLKLKNISKEEVKLGLSLTVSSLYGIDTTSDYWLVTKDIFKKEFFANKLWQNTFRRHIWDTLKQI